MWENCVGGVIIVQILCTYAYKWKNETCETITEMGRR
jgi:hypothetical protein